MALQGKDTADQATLNIEDVDALESLNDGVGGLRIAFAESKMFADLDPATEQAVRACGDVFKSLGAQVDSIDYPEADQALKLPLSPSMVEGCFLNSERLDEQFDQLDPVVAERMILGRDLKATDYAKTLHLMQQLQASSQHRLRNVDVILAPTSMIPARPISEVDASIDNYMQHAGMYMRNCFVGNLLNLCAVTVPCGFTEQGLPIGLMIYAKPLQEGLALRVGQAFEQATDWHKQHPALDWL